MNAVVEYGSYVVDVIESSMYSASEHTGLRWGPMTPQQYWFRRPIIHFTEFLILHAVCFFFYWLTAGYFSETVMSSTRGKFRRLKNSWIDKCLGIFFVLSFISQIYAKGSRPAGYVQLGWLLMPCHVFSILWAIALLSNKGKRHEGDRARSFAVYLASMMLTFNWAPITAYLQPDMSDHRNKWEGTVFVIHHALLCCTPIYFGVRYYVIPISEMWFVHITWVGTIFFLDVLTAVSFLIGLNVGYNLCPPVGFVDKMPFVFGSHIWYRYSVMIVLIMVSVSSRFVCGFFVIFFKWAISQATTIFKSVAGQKPQAKKVRQE